MTATDGASGDSPKAHYGKLDDPRMSADEMDLRRKENIAYEYLCHLEEAKVWIEACINEKLPPSTELEEGLQNGVYLAKLAHFISADLVPLKKIYDRDQTRFEARGLHFRHTDNICHWLRSLEEIALPKIFYPETTDIYDRKNMPRCIYCIHALSLYLFKLGRAPQIQDLYGKIKFTDEEISAMRLELEKYGIQMPAFSKIGGILANEMPVDEAALHAAVIAINEAVEHQVPENTLQAMKNPAAHLNNMYDDLADMYQNVLYDAKQNKAEIARNKNQSSQETSLDPDSSYIPDVYDELLTQAEIQGNINISNTMFALESVNAALERRDAKTLLKCLRLPHLGLRDIKDENAEFYLNRLTEIREYKQNNNTEDELIGLSKDEVQMAVQAANLDADTDYQKMLAVKGINEALEGQDPQVTLRALQNPAAQLPQVMNNAGQLYHFEFRNIKAEKQGPLEHEEIIGGVTVLTALAKVNQAVDTGNSGFVYQALQNPDAHIMNLDDECHDKYAKYLAEKKREKKTCHCDLLTHFEVQQGVNDVNEQVHEENEQSVAGIAAVGIINQAVDEGDPQATLTALKMKTAQLQNVDNKQALHYQNLLATKKQQRAEENSDPSAVLWYNDIQNTIQEANSQALDANKMSVGVAAINIATETGDVNNLLNCLTNSDVFLHSVTPECAQIYMDVLSEVKENKSKQGECGGGWMMNRTKEGYKFYFNVNTMEYAWERPKDVTKDHSILTREEIQATVCEITAAHDRELLFKSNQPFIVKLQAQTRGYLARKRYKERLEFMKTQLPAIVSIQSWWRMQKERRSYEGRRSHLYSNIDSVVKLQAYVRMYIARRKYMERLKYFQDNEHFVIKIQAFMRANWAKNDYKLLMHGENPPVGVVRKFVHLLDLGDIDYTEEIELEKLRQQVVGEIKSNQSLESDLNQMDIKIGLLVKNRITLQDVISQHKTLKQYREYSSSALNKQGLKSLSKQSRERLEAYQHLFYLLQTNPVYLARLIFEMPQSRTTKFMETVILTLYNYASNQREEYLLLKLFKTALKEEISSKVDKMSDIVTGNPMVVKMIVSFNRNARGQGSLRELLNPFVKEVVENKTLLINTNPVEVYKQWINQFESESGKASGLPYDVTPEQALEHEEVRERINQSVVVLQQATDKFLSAILKSPDKIPYGMRYMAKVLQDALHHKFPDAPEKDVLKIVGNLIYYRYINSAIVAPDAFDIIDVTAHKGLTNDQRRNLGSVAKILQFAASNKGFGGDSAHLSCLNPYIMEAHTKFKKYFKTICEVEEPEARFNVDQYTDVAKVTKPMIYIQINEIIETHKLLLEHQDAIAPDHNDPLHELLEDLGEAPSVEALIGDVGVEDQSHGHKTQNQLAKTEISLTLSNKFEVPEDDKSDITNLMLRTKRMVVDVIRCQERGDNLRQILDTPALEEEENEHQALIRRRDKVDQRAASRKSKLVRQQSVVSDVRLPLDSMKQKIESNLNDLEKAMVVSHKDNYQAVINSIVRDIRNQRLYRQRRKQEMIRLRQTLKGLATKRSFYEEQIDYYNQYVKTCLDNLSSKSKRSSKRISIFSRDSGPKAKGSIKYSGAKLHEKGVILEIEGLPTNQFKNVLFEISATESVGIFDVSAKFMGVAMEKVELIFQDLLQLQYEGVAVMKMFDKARVNVNLLIFLINKKFYGK